MGFANSLARCLCERRELDDDSEKGDELLKKIQPGHKYTVKVIRVENGKYWVSMKQSVLGAEDDTNAGYSQPVMDFEEQFADVESHLVPRPVLIDESSCSKKRGGVSVVFSSAGSTDPLEDDSLATNASSLPSKKKAKKEKESAKKLKEESVRSKEAHLLSGDWRSNPQSPEEFERLLLVESNSAQPWIKYMSYWLKMTEVGKARETAERALKCAGNFPNEQEKFNLLQFLQSRLRKQLRFMLSLLHLLSDSRWDFGFLESYHVDKSDLRLWTSNRATRGNN